MSPYKNKFKKIKGIKLYVKKLVAKKKSDAELGDESIRKKCVVLWMKDFEDSIF